MHTGDDTVGRLPEITASNQHIRISSRPLTLCPRCHGTAEKPPPSVISHLLTRWATNTIVGLIRSYLPEDLGLWWCPRCELLYTEVKA